MRIRGTSEGLDPSALVAGKDLVLHAAPGHGGALAEGVLLDDWLDAQARASVDLSANRALAAWRERRDAALTVDEVCLPFVHEGELFADVFLREQRVFDGVRAALSAASPRGVKLQEMDGALGAALVELAASLGVEAERAGPPRPAPSYPIEFARSAGRDRQLLGALSRNLGAPGWPRGAVLVKPFWHLTPVLRRLSAVGARPVLDPADLPTLPPRALLGMAARGGWTGHPGWRSRRRSAAALAGVLEAPSTGGTASLEALFDERARRLLAQRARDTVAQVESLRRALRPSRVRAAVVPSDGSPGGRITLLAARDAGVSVVQVQHGFFGDLWRLESGSLAPYIDGLEADRVAVWSKQQADLLSGQGRGEVVVTGNPGGAVSADGAAASGDGTVVVLVQPPGGATSTFDVRAPHRHVRVALRAVEQWGGARRVVLRPHPLDPTDLGGAGSEASGLEVSVQREGSVEQLLSQAMLCVGPLSTATLQASVAGVPTAFLSLTETRLPWPFDGSGAFPTARDADDLASLIPEVVAGRVSGSEAATEALGLRADAVDRVVELVLGRSSAGR